MGGCSPIDAPHTLKIWSKNINDNPSYLHLKSWNAMYYNIWVGHVLLDTLYKEGIINSYLPVYNPDDIMYIPYLSSVKNCK